MLSSHETDVNKHLHNFGSDRCFQSVSSCNLHSFECKHKADVLLMQHSHKESKGSCRSCKCAQHLPQHSWFKMVYPFFSTCRCLLGGKQKEAGFICIFVLWIKIHSPIRRRNKSVKRNSIKTKSGKINRAAFATLIITVTVSLSLSYNLYTSWRMR